MISTVFNGATVYLVTEEPNWDFGVTSESSMYRGQAGSLTHREGRRGYGDTLLNTLRYTASVSGEGLRDLAGALRLLTTESVIVPFWPAIGYWADRATAGIKGGLMVVWKDGWTQFEIYAAGAEPGWPAAGDFVAPALMGFFTRSESPLSSRELQSWAVDFTESSPAGYAMLPAAAAAVAGPKPAGYAVAPALLPFVPEREMEEEISVTVKREQLSFTRTQFNTYYPHTAERMQRGTFVLQGDDSGALLRWLMDVGGPGAAFWAPSGLLAAELTAPALAAASVLHVGDTSALIPGDYVIANGRAGFTLWTPGQVQSLTTNTITLTGAVGVALDAGELVFPLCLARLDKPMVKLDWQRPGVATAELDWTEVPAEYAIAADETLGVTIGQQAKRVILFEFNRDLGNGTVATWRFTNFEKDLNWGGHAWASADFSHGEITQSLNLENDVVQITSFITAGNPLVDDYTLVSEAPLSVIVRWANWDGASVSNVATVFSGSASAVKRAGNKLTAQCKFGPALLDTQLPRMIRGMICNHLGGSNNDGSFLISAGCTLLKADWQFTGLVANPISPGWPYALAVSGLARVSGAAPTFLANWFANGWVEFGAGANIQRRLIVGSTLPVAGAVTLTLHRYFTALPALGAAVVIYPGCDGVYATCKAYNAGTNPLGKFDNGVNFGGEPFTPIANPSMVGQPSLNTQGGKK